ncbi:cobalamin biosynthesis protein [Actinoplanes sp. LDG1-06]|uniref:Cobalamin biosynthesis protein n=1 Tax=Paractinoplanes ovalisporus TaxID=2810368 RepID=A0ABS2AJF6_9ACTN|nr:cobalamin biosynthesis protein [Actinoplanes ovalisporus]MBM2619977.1 cobalamin biosynthesis protein [Actinoplanes ovalisporus]
MTGWPGRGRAVVVGLGARPSATMADLLTAVDTTLTTAGLSASDVTTLATLDRRGGDSAVREMAVDRGWQLALFAAADLAATPVPSPSGAVAAAVGTPSVAEAAALRAAGPDASLLVPKRIFPNVTVAIATAVFTKASREFLDPLG